ncbi:MAG: hypothetical protein NC253_12315 [Ruminococcus sp.]|nr:hypothetical protein [Ruminococcus sp.]MCM1380989.1 hypothetical protein [Muribaculaceae bacterium]MCM1478657.1 hypothetical protein [Muribaculaceae bacterium]
MKKIFTVVVFLLYCLAMLILSLRISDSEKYISRLEIHLENYETCNEYQAEMSTYIAEHYDGILSFGKRVLADFDKLTYKDEYGIAQMDRDTYLALENEYNLNYFSENSRSYIEFYEDKIHFVYKIIDFENENYGYFHFVFENGKIEICPYDYECYQYGL